MSTEANKQAVIRFLRDGWSGHSLEAIEEYFSESATWYGVAEGIDAIKQAVSFWFEVLPDMVLTSEDLTAEEDRVAFRWEAQGTHRGELFGVPPTDKQVTFGGVAINRFENGKCVHYRETWDRAGLLEQLGVIQTDTTP